jgi:hypothetical protein
MEMTAIRWKVIGDVRRFNDASIDVDAKEPTCETTLAQGEVSPYDPSALDSLILGGAKEVVIRRDELSSAGYVVERIQFGVNPVMAKGLRPSFNLSSDAICALASLRASLDFDPY